MEWVPVGGLATLFGIAALLIWRLVRLGVNQENALLKPAYTRIERLEKYVTQLERERAAYIRALLDNGIPIPRVEGS